MHSNVTRRSFLAAGAASTVALAGCLGGGQADFDDLEVNDRPELGSEDAPVTVVVFEDFACPSCADFKQRVFPDIERQFIQQGDVRYVHADWPIPVDEQWTYAVGSGARAVFEVGGNDAFWAFASDIYDHIQQYSYDDIETVARDVADLETVDANGGELGTAALEAAQGDTYRDVLEDDRDMGEDWGVSGTPTVFVDEQRIEPGDVLEEIADSL